MILSSRERNPSFVFQSTTSKSTEKRSSSAISALRRRLVGNNSSSHRRDRSIPEDDPPPVESNPAETMSADDILARYSNKGSTSVDNGSKLNSAAEESHAESNLVSIMSGSN